MEWTLHLKDYGTPYEANEGSVISKAFIGSDTISATVINSQVQDRSSDEPLMQTLNCGLPLAWAAGQYESSLDPNKKGAIRYQIQMWQ